MPIVAANGLDICYEEFGSADDPAVLLVMGFSAQMIVWDEEFCTALADRGLRVIRFDNRDVGLSSKIDAGGPVDLAQLFHAMLSGAEVDAPYTLDDMAADAFGLLDALGIDRAHVVGASMGGMIVQHMALARPERVASMVSIMSTTGDPTVGQPRPEVIASLLQPPPPDRTTYVEHMVAMTRMLNGGVAEFDEDRARERAERAYDRAYYPEGAPRQLLAVLASGDRTQRLRSVTSPTLVIHGALDPLVDVSGGRATAEAIPGARLVVLPDGGHGLAPSHWPIVIDEIANHASSGTPSPAPSR
jgi:pimeloyl-ACP methyl ester carboxylesterase